MILSLEERFRVAGYECLRDRNLGPAEAAIYACRDVWWSGFPCYVNYYVFEFADGAVVDLVEVEGFRGLARYWTLIDRFRKPRPWYRGSLFSIVILWSRGGFTERAVRFVARPSNHRIIGHPCLILLFDPDTSEVYTLSRVPFVGGAFFGPAIREATGFLTACARDDAMR